MSQGSNGLPCVTFNNLPPPLPPKSVPGSESNLCGSMKEDVRNATIVLLRVCSYSILYGPTSDKFCSSLSNMWRTLFLYPRKCRKSHNFRLTPMNSSIAALRPRTKSHSRPTHLRSLRSYRKTSPFFGLWTNVYRLNVLSVRPLPPYAKCSSVCAGHPLCPAL